MKVEKTRRIHYRYRVEEKKKSGRHREEERKRIFS